jgi:hypothetical protein
VDVDQNLISRRARLDEIGDVEGFDTLKRIANNGAHFTLHDLLRGPRWSRPACAIWTVGARMD